MPRAKEVHWPCGVQPHFRGKNHVDEHMIETLSNRLGADDRRQLKKDIRYAPAWIAEIIRQLAEMDDSRG